MADGIEARLRLIELASGGVKAQLFTGPQDTGGKLAGVMHFEPDEWSALGGRRHVNSVVPIRIARAS